MRILSASSAARFYHLSYDVFRFPVVSNVNLRDLAIRIYDHGSQSVNDLVLLREICEPKKLRNVFHLPGCASGKFPVCKSLVLVALSVCSTIAAQHLRRVVRGIDADAEQVSLFIELRILA